MRVVCAEVARGHGMRRRRCMRFDCPLRAPRPRPRARTHVAPAGSSHRAGLPLSLMWCGRAHSPTWRLRRSSACPHARASTCHASVRKLYVSVAPAASGLASHPPAAIQRSGRTNCVCACAAAHDCVAPPARPPLAARRAEGLVRTRAWCLVSRMSALDAAAGPRATVGCPPRSRSRNCGVDGQRSIDRSLLLHARERCLARVDR